MDNGFKIQPETFEENLKMNKGILDAVIYLKGQQLTLDVIVNDELDIDLKKELDHLDIHINYVEEIKHNKMGKIDRSYYKNL